MMTNKIIHTVGDLLNNGVSPKESIPETQYIFENVVCGMAKKIEETTDTIFTGINLLEDIENIKECFNENIDVFAYMNAQPYDKRKMVKEFMENTYLAEVFTFTVDNLISESTLGALSFSQQYKIENTKSELGIKYLGENIDLNPEYRLYEESFIGNASISGAIGAAGALLGAPLFPIIAVSTAAVLAVELLVPIAWSAKKEASAQKYLGSIGKLLFTSKPFFISSSSPINSSINNIIQFDNLHMNPEVNKLFLSLQKSATKQEVITNLEAIFITCQDKSIMDVNNINHLSEEELQNVLKTKYDKSKVNLMSLFYNNVMKKATTGEESNNAALTFRRCVIEKLLDLYKYLVLANAVNSREYLKIAKSLTSVDHGNTEQLFSFVSSVDDNDKNSELLRENLITLVQLRIEFDKMARELSRGAFKIDTESGKYFEQLLKRTDREIEDQLRNHGKKIDTLYESRKDFQQKDFKNNPQNVKRSLFSFNNDKPANTSPQRPSYSGSNNQGSNGYNGYNGSNNFNRDNRDNNQGSNNFNSAQKPGFNQQRPSYSNNNMNNNNNNNNGNRPSYNN